MAGVKALSRAWPVCTCGNTTSPFSLSISTGMCLEPRVPAALPPTGPGVHACSMKPVRACGGCTVADASLNLLLPATERNSPQVPHQRQTGWSCGQEGSPAVAPASSQGPCTPNLTSGLCTGGSRPKMRQGLRASAWVAVQLICIRLKCCLPGSFTAAAPGLADSETLDAEQRPRTRPSKALSEPSCLVWETEAQPEGSAFSARGIHSEGLV